MPRRPAERPAEQDAFVRVQAPAQPAHQGTGPGVPDPVAQGLAQPQIALCRMPRPRLHHEEMEQALPQATREAVPAALEGQVDGFQRPGGRQTPGTPAPPRHPERHQAHTCPQAAEDHGVRPQAGIEDRLPAAPRPGRKAADRQRDDQKAKLVLHRRPPVLDEFKRHPVAVVLAGPGSPRRPHDGNRLEDGRRCQERKAEARGDEHVAEGQGVVHGHAQLEVDRRAGVPGHERRLPHPPPHQQRREEAPDDRHNASPDQGRHVRRRPVGALCRRHAPVCLQRVRHLRNLRVRG